MTKQQLDDRREHTYRGSLTLVGSLYLCLRFRRSKSNGNPPPQTQLFAALSFALLAGCSTDSGVISKKEGNQQVSSSPNSPIQRLADVDSESTTPARRSKEQKTGDIDNHSTHQPTATATPSKDQGVKASDLQAKGVEPPIPVTHTTALEAPDPVVHQSSAPTAAEQAAEQQEADRLEREAAELAAAQQEADRLKREAAELAAEQQEADRLEREAAELAAAQQEADRLERSR